MVDCLMFLILSSCDQRDGLHENDDTPRHVGIRGFCGIDGLLWRS